MSKAADVGKVSVKGSFNLMWGLVASTVISAFGTIYLANLLSPDEMGLYALALAAPTLIGVFRDWGINSALIKYTAQYNSENQIVRTKKILVTGLIFEVVTGVVLTIFSFFLSFLFANLYQLAAITPLIQIASFTILVNAFLAVAQAAFMGLERMELNSVTLIIQSIVKVVLIISLVILGLGVFGAVVGYTVAFIIAGVTGTLLLWVLQKRLISQSQSLESARINSRKITWIEIKQNAKTLLKYGVPLSIGTIIAAFQTQFYTLLMGVFATANGVGNYSVASTFVVLITFFASPITMALFPAFSKLEVERDHAALKSIFQFSVKYAALLVVPVVAIVMALSGPAISTLFGNKYDSAPLFLALLAINYLYTAFGSLSVSNLLSGQGKTKFVMGLGILGAVIGFPSSLILATQFGIVGIIVASIVAGFPGTIVALYWISKHYRMGIDWISSAKILFSSALAGGITYIVQSWLVFSSLVTLVIGVVTFLVVFMPSMLLIGTLNHFDIENMRQMTSSLGPVNRLLSPVFYFIERFLLIIGKSDGKPLQSEAPVASPL
jgi:O-antigen/teichoic acid export membrane protein